MDATPCSNLCNNTPVLFFLFFIKENDYVYLYYKQIYDKNA